jgi:hypothetical protein
MLTSSYKSGDSNDGKQTEKRKSSREESKIRKHDDASSV